MGLFNGIATAGVNLFNSVAYSARTTFFGYTPAEKAAIVAQGKAADDAQAHYFATTPNANYADYYMHLAGKTATGIIDQTGIPATQITQGVSSVTQAVSGLNLKTVGIVALVIILVMKILRR